jgi:hypothetical protein
MMLPIGVIFVTPIAETATGTPLGIDSIFPFANPRRI